MYNIDQVVETLLITRWQFSHLFLTAQYNLGILVQDRAEFEAIGLSASDKEAFKEALKFAKKISGFYNEMIRLIRKNGYDQGKLTTLDSGSAISNKAPLQAIANANKGFIDPGYLYSNLNKAVDWTGKVLINGQPKGTGVLIGPKRFLTSWHNIEEMFTIDHTSISRKYIPKENGPTLAVMFGDYTDFMTGKYNKNKLRTIDAAEDWNEIFSICHEDEYEHLPNPLIELKGFWDYAIIRLSEAIDYEGNWAVLEKRAIVPEDQASITVLQYPEGYNLKMASDEITSLTPPDAAIPDIRFLHHSNTEHGSSGGPCFDRDFTLIGIHQGTWPTKINDKITNRGIPIRNIISDIESKQVSNTKAANALMGTVPEDYFVWYTDKKSYNPILGMDDFQLMILKNNIEQDKGYIISIQGEKGGGKTFCIITLFSLLNDVDHLKILLPADQISKMDCVTVANSICKSAGSASVTFEKQEDYNSTTAVWLRDGIVNKVLEVLESKRNRKKVWLCISNLNQYDIEDKNTADFLWLLYESILRHTWLQIVLDGMKADLPASLIPVRQVYTVNKKTQEDIQKYIDRFMVELKIKPEPHMIMAFSGLLFNQYNNQLNQNPQEAIGFLAEQCKSLLMQFLNKIT